MTTTTTTKKNLTPAQIDLMRDLLIDENTRGGGWMHVRARRTVVALVRAGMVQGRDVFGVVSVRLTHAGRVFLLGSDAAAVAHEKKAGVNY